MRIKEAIKDKITGEWGDADDVGLGVQVLRTTNFTNAGRISYSEYKYSHNHCGKRSQYDIVTS